MVLASSVFLPAIAPADEAQERRDEAVKLFTQGTTAIDNGDFVSGCVLMRQSVELFPVPNSLFQVAQCNEREGKLLAARTYWDRGLSLLDATDKRVPVVKQSLEALATRIPRVRILVPKDQKPATISLDDSELQRDQFGQLIEVDPGKHVVLVKRAGHEDNRVEVVLNEKERTEVTASLGPKGSAGVGPVPTATTSSTGKPPPPPPPPPPPSGLRIGGIAALGVGIAGAIGAGVTGGLIESHDGDVGKSCREMALCNASETSAKESVQSLLPANAALWVVGIAGVGASVTMLVLSSMKSAPNKDRAPNAFVMPIPTNNGLGVGVIGRF